jgi:hypothetical protein
VTERAAELGAPIERHLLDAAQPSAHSIALGPAY